MKNKLKTIAILIISILLSKSSDAQLVVTAEAPKHYDYSSIPSFFDVDYYISDPAKNDTTFLFEYRNQKYKTIVDYNYFSYTGNSQDLYDLFINQLEAEKDTYITIELNGKEFGILTTSFFGVKQIMFSDDTGFIILNRMYINKMFNK